MKNFVKKNINILFVCLIELVVGILLLIDPNAFTSAVIVMAGIVIMGVGLYSSVRYFKDEPEKAAQGQLLMTGLVLLLAGGFCVFRSGWFISTLPLYTVIYGVVILALALCKVQVSVDSVRLWNKKWWLFAIGSALGAVCAVVVLVDPFGELASLWTFTGVSLTVIAVYDIVSFILSKIDLTKKESTKDALPETDESEPEASEEE